jgi:2OG-Fe(II) oxygenase superfamily
VYTKELLFPGLWVYRNVISDEVDAINRIENIISSSVNSETVWKDATVGYHQKIPSYRDCVDFKLGNNPYAVTAEQITLNKLWQDLHDVQNIAVVDYCNAHNIQMEYWEVMNIVKYGPGQHFQEHADHGFSYSATVSLVAYPNDDYEGGELTFPKLGLKIKPKAGDLYIFPSTYIYSHKAEAVTSGQKYSIVTMLDYNDHAHNQKFYEMRQELVAQKGNGTISNAY